MRRGSVGQSHPHAPSSTTSLKSGAPIVIAYCLRARSWKCTSGLWSGAPSMLTSSRTTAFESMTHEATRAKPPSMFILCWPLARFETFGYTPGLPESLCACGSHDVLCRFETSGFRVMVHAGRAPISLAAQSLCLRLVRMSQDGPRARPPRSGKPRGLLSIELTQLRRCATNEQSPRMAVTPHGSAATSWRTRDSVRLVAVATSMQLSFAPLQLVRRT